MEKKDWETDWGRWRGGIKDGNEYFERDISEDFDYTSSGQNREYKTGIKAIFPRNDREKLKFEYFKDYKKINGRWRNFFSREDFLKNNIKTEYAKEIEEFENYFKTNAKEIIHLFEYADRLNDTVNKIDGILNK